MQQLHKIIAAMPWLFASFAQSATGVINFTGAISEPSCIVSGSSERFEVSCTRNGVLKKTVLKEGLLKKITPYDLAVMSQSQRPSGGRDIILEYR